MYYNNIIVDILQDGMCRKESLALFANRRWRKFLIKQKMEKWKIILLLISCGFVTKNVSIDTHTIASKDSQHTVNFLIECDMLKERHSMASLKATNLEQSHCFGENRFFY